LKDNYSAFQEYFKLPFAGERDYSTAKLSKQGSNGYYWSSSPYSSGEPYSSRDMRLDSSHADMYMNNSRVRSFGSSVRCFKDSYVDSPETSNLVDTQAWVEGKDFETITISNPDDVTQ
jgi:hypothetical protein